MNAKSYLLQYKIMNRRLSHLEKEIEKICADVEAVNMIGDGMPKRTGKSDKVGNVAVRLADLRTQYQNEIMALWEKRAEIYSVISQVDDDMQMQLLYDRYLLSMQWHEIAKDIHVAEEYARGRLHGIALQKVEKILNRLQKVT